MDEHDIENQLAKILSESASAPFLFIGSGFSRRYINLPDWEGLLQKFSTKPFASYLGRANDDIPTATLDLARVYYEEWWADTVGKEHIYQSKDWLNKTESPLKYEISEYLKNYEISDVMLDHPELLELRNEKVVLDGIITTNWDLLLEKIFPKLKAYVGQSDILFKHPQEIGEILKIHGCCTRHNSLILSSTDYEGFNKRNPYLASKLISIFLEKPVIFLGYSIRDKNITDILEVIESVIDSEEKVEQLAKNMIFVERAKGNDEISKIVKNINGKSLTFTNIKTDDFGKVFRALQHSERKIPVEILRVFKEQIYNIVNSKDKANLRLKAIDFESVLEGEDIEFVAGVGVASASEYGMKGLSGITARDLCEDIIFNNIHFKIEKVGEILPSLVKITRTYIPIRKYMDASGSPITRSTSKNVKTRLKMSSKSFFDKLTNKTVVQKQVKSIVDPKDIIGLSGKDKKTTFNMLAVWLYMNQSLKNIELVREIVVELIEGEHEKWFSDSKPCYSFKGLICIIDELENNELRKPLT